MEESLKYETFKPSEPFTIQKYNSYSNMINNLLQSTYKVFPDKRSNFYIINVRNGILCTLNLHRNRRGLASKLHCFNHII